MLQLLLVQFLSSLSASCWHRSPDLGICLIFQFLLCKRLNHLEWLYRLVGKSSPFFYHAVLYQVGWLLLFVLWYITGTSHIIRVAVPLIFMTLSDLCSSYLSVTCNSIFTYRSIVLTIIITTTNRSKLHIYKVLSTQIYYIIRAVTRFIDLNARSLLAHFIINFVYMQESTAAIPIKEGNKTIGISGFFARIWYTLEKKMNFTWVHSVAVNQHCNYAIMRGRINAVCGVN